MNLITFKRISPAILIMIGVGLCFAGCRSKQTPEASANALRYDLKGKVVSSDKANHQVTVAHEEIPGYMQAMTMPFSLQDDWVYDVLTPGATLHATLVVDRDKSWLENPTVTQVSNPDLTRSEETGVEPGAGTETPDFTLVNQDGKKISLKKYRGRTLVLTFIYTRCPLPDYCPLMTRNFALIHEGLQRNPALKQNTHLLSVSVDPEHDRPNVLRQYGLKQFESNQTEAFKTWEFATGTSDQVKAVAQFFGLNYWKENGQIIHGLRTAIIGPDGKVVRIFRGNQWKPEQALAELERINQTPGG